VKYLILAGVLSLSAAACHQKDPSASSSTGKESIEPAKKTFFPVADYLNGEIGYVDSTPLAITKYNMEGKKTDSSFISPQIFHQLAQEFLPSELDTTFFNKEYKESSFMDETTKSLNFTYSTDNKSLVLQRVDVRATRADNGTDKISSIYEEKKEDRNDTLVIKKMYWQAKKQFQVVTMTSTHGQKALIRQLKVVWDQGE
jgi:hypothetical protein